MVRQAGGPRWRWLYAVILFIVGLLILDARASLLPAGHEILEVGIVLVGYGLIELWIRANAQTLTAGSRSAGVRQAESTTAWRAAADRSTLFVEDGPYCAPIRHSWDGDEIERPEQTPISLN